MFGRKALHIQQLQDEIHNAYKARNNWQETALYYTELLDKIAEHFGIEAYRCDDGSFSDDPLRAKMPDLVSDLVRQLHYYKNQRPVIEAEFIFIDAVNP